MYDPLIGTTIDGRYIIEALLGEGGMGFVYAARHAIIDKRVAIKVLRKEAAADEASAQRFIIEAKAASKIGHQNIVDITDFGILPAGNAYFVMEYLDGPTLGRLVHELKTLPALRSLNICSEVARGLYAAHQKSIIHRDLKPENIFVLEKDGEVDTVKIVDFGIAKDVKAGKRLTAIGMVLGTPEYMSPEQATGQETDHRVDQYALGCILYEMLTGDVPFKAENAPKTLTKHVFEAVVPPSKFRPDLQIPDIVEKIVLKMLQKKPDDRYADMRQLIAGFEVAQQSLEAGATSVRTVLPVDSAQARAAAPTDTLDELPRNRTPRYVGVVVGAAALLVLGTVAVTQLTRPRAKTPPVVGATVTPPAPVEQPAGQPPAAVKPTVASAEVQVQVSTIPPGAEVYLGSELVGTAPIDVKRTRSGEPVTFTVRLAGHKDVTRTVALDRDQSLEVMLQPKRDKVAVRTTRPQPRTQAAQPAAPASHHVSDLRNPFE
ncbi:MAG: serine/threonine protein kinase [Myxococcales bacterium]|nr:serine/threonine protein kinase [Myxococcales bacterium]